MLGIGILVVFVLGIYTLIGIIALRFALSVLPLGERKQANYYDTIELRRKLFESRDSFTSELNGFESSAVMDEEDEGDD